MLPRSPTLLLFPGPDERLTIAVFTLSHFPQTLPDLPRVQTSSTQNIYPLALTIFPTQSMTCQCNHFPRKSLHIPVQWIKEQLLYLSRYKPSHGTDTVWAAPSPVASGSHRSSMSLETVRQCMSLMHMPAIDFSQRPNNVRDRNDHLGLFLM